jgi:hypothetical protein
LGDLNINKWPDLGIKKVTGIDPIRIEEVQNISPVAHHVKEVNNIDPISVDEFHINEVKNIDPIKVDKFHITNIPPVNVVLRHLPKADMAITEVPPLSVGLHQDFDVPSHYSVSGHLLGFELFRLFLDGHSRIIPKDKYRNEQSLDHNRSFPKPAVKGNQAIPSEFIHEQPIPESLSGHRHYPQHSSHTALRLRR